MPSPDIVLPDGWKISTISHIQKVWFSIPVDCRYYPTAAVSGRRYTPQEISPAKATPYPLLLLPVSSFLWFFTVIFPVFRKYPWACWTAKPKCKSPMASFFNPIQILFYTWWWFLLKEISCWTPSKSFHVIVVPKTINSYLFHSYHPVFIHKI